MGRVARCVGVSVCGGASVATGKARSFLTKMSEKRAHSPERDSLSGAIVLGKKQKTGGEIVIGSVTKDGVKRTSNLQAPIMQLIGHGAEVYSMKFSPDGQSLASGSFDKLVYLWRTFGDCPNYMILKVRSGCAHAAMRLAMQGTCDQLPLSLSGTQERNPGSPMVPRWREASNLLG